MNHQNDIFVPKLLDRVDEDLTSDSGNIRILFFTDAHLTHATPISRKDEYCLTMLSKLDFLAEAAKKLECDLVLMGGDLWHTKNQPDTYTIDVIHSFDKFTCPVYTVVGNHDIYYARVNTLSKTPLGLVLASGKVKRLGNIRIQMGSLEVLIHGFDYVLNPVLPEAINLIDNNINILVTHNFLFSTLSSFAPEETIKIEEFEKSRWDIFLVGHDHMTYPEMIKKDKKILRPGALSRGTKHVQNRMRDVCFNTIDVKSTGEVITNQIRIPVKPSDEIYSNVQIEREEISKKMTEFVKALATKASAEEAEIEVMLKKLCGNNIEVYDNIVKYLFDFGVTYNK